MIRTQVLARTPLVCLARFDHPASQAHRDPEEEITSEYSINFVERGQFELQARRRQWRLSPGCATVTPPGFIYRYRHQERFPSDVCLSVIYDENFFDDFQARATGTGRKNAPWVVPPTNRLTHLRRVLTERAEQQEEALALETLGAELLAAVAEPPGGRLYRERQLAWYSDRIEAARTRLETQYAEAHSLTSLSRAAAMSPFHFARVFRQLIGTPPHRYLLQVRLTRAAEHLRHGEGVTETCFACGFNNLSHFIRLFRRTFGVSPSRFRH